MISVAALTAGLVLLAPATPASATAATVHIDMSNFRFCRHAPCVPSDQGYVRGPNGPVANTDNSVAIIDVPSGATVVWTYRDSLCDQFAACPGHMVMLENGSPGGQSVGMADARKGPTTVTYQIHEKPGTLIRYFCNVNHHDQFGQTGILLVIA